MPTKSLFPFLFFLLFSFTTSYGFVNDTVATAKKDEPNFETLIQNIVKQSVSYQDFKLIKNADITTLQTVYKVEEASFKNSIIELQGKLTTLEGVNKDLTAQNESLLKKYNVKVAESESESSYTVTYISSIIVLFLLLFYFIHRSNNLSNLYKNHKKDIESIELEFEDYKRIAIEREQKIKRELINLTNKSNQSNPRVYIDKAPVPPIENKEVTFKDSKKIDLDELLVNKIEEPSAEENLKEDSIVMKLDPSKNTSKSNIINKKRKG